MFRLFESFLIVMLLSNTQRLYDQLSVLGLLIKFRRHFLRLIFLIDLEPDRVMLKCLCKVVKIVLVSESKMLPQSRMRVEGIGQLAQIPTMIS